jgi:hypothetical protein
LTILVKFALTGHKRQIRRDGTRHRIKVNFVKLDTIGRSSLTRLDKRSR